MGIGRPLAAVLVVDRHRGAQVASLARGDAGAPRPAGQPADDVPRRGAALAATLTHQRWV